MIFSSVKKALGGDALPATLFVLLYTAYTLAFSLSLSVYLIRAFYVAYYAMAIYYLVKVFGIGQKSVWLKSYNGLFLIGLVFSIVSFFTSTSEILGNKEIIHFITIWVQSFLPVFAFYYWGVNNRINSDWFCFITIFFIADVFLLYYQNSMSVIQNIDINTELGYTNNVGYEWASLLPLAVFFKKRNLFQYVIIVLVAIFVLICVKRGAILVSGLAILYFLGQNIKVSGSKRVITLIFIGVAFYIIWRFSNQLIETNAYFLQRFELTKEGNSSGRDDIYSFFLNYYLSEENGLGLLWGNGVWGTIKIYGIEAHNDWLEIAIDMGLIGLFAFAKYFFSSIKKFISIRHYVSDDIRIAMGMVLIIVFVRSFFSMSIYDMSFISSAILGYTMAVGDISKRYAVAFD